MINARNKTNDLKNYCTPKLGRPKIAILFYIFQLCVCGSRGKAVQTMKSRKHKNLPAFSRTDKEKKKIRQLIGEKRTFFDGLTPRFFFLMRPSLNEIWIDLMG
ncbi:hypothetical protein OUZ56_006553 [Daphnia magna]|uniref:Uncharacterized protein n=1 Tax=Daphnia magna TaxID=35525 RepID=A0ABQ9YW02_9CRUS|nr:hypothetical protein OUZ56_006553 [Daphnia magna]